MSSAFQSFGVGMYDLTTQIAESDKMNTAVLT